MASVAPPAAAGYALLRRPGLTLVLGGAAFFVLLFIVLLGGLVGAGSSEPSQAAVADIPAEYLVAYQRTGERYGIDWAVLAAIGKVECDHGRNPSSGCNPPGTVNVAGATGPMQFLGSTWRAGTPPMTVPAVGSPTSTTSAGYAADGDGDGLADVWNPADAIAGAARLLRANGAPTDYRRAILAYNHADWYVREVLTIAESYRTAVAVGPVMLDPAVTLRAVLQNPRIQLTPIQQADLASGAIDPRVVAVLAWIGQAHTIVVTSIRSDHPYLTVNGTVSNHSYGRAVDIGAVDGEVCTGSRTGACGRLAVELARLGSPLHSTELIYCFDPDESFSADGFARADHCDHVHFGYDK
jgi:hypothetical protein